ncbi:MAG: hypothetical protein MUC41_11415 [Syntrophobacteraceae bacterium]|nr:hypothetical protein [Syntrophobacteraceae bacterium]
MFTDVNENDACVVNRGGFETMAEHRRLCPPTGGTGAGQSALTRKSKGGAP